MIKQKNIYGETGQTLLEMLLAFSVLVLVLSAAILGITTSLSNAQYTRNQNLANSYAKEGMTMVRQIRDSSWDDFSKKSAVNYCLPQDAVALSDYDGANCINGGKVGIFIRSVTLVHGSSDCSAGSPPIPTPTPPLIQKGSKVTIKVSWSDSKCPAGNPFCDKVELITCFSNIDIKPTP